MDDFETVRTNKSQWLLMQVLLTYKQAFTSKKQKTLITKTPPWTWFVNIGVRLHPTHFKLGCISDASNSWQSKKFKS